MQARTMILTALIGGPLVGTLLGITANPTMKAPPEPAWRSAQPDPIYAQPQRVVEKGPQDLSTSWYVDRTPTWKRRAAELQAAAYASLPYADPPAEQPEELPAPAPKPERASGPKVVTWPATPLTEAAAQQAPDRDARAGLETEAQPALVDAAPAPAL
jgi:hypothetical protein